MSPVTASRLLLDRRLTIGVMAAAAFAVLLLVLVPQRPTGAQPLGGLGGALHLDAIASAWWFRALASFASLQLVVATVHLARRDIRRLRRPRGPAGETFEVLDTAGLQRALRDAHYRRAGADAPAFRFTRHRWAYLAPTALHLGMLLAVLGVVTVTMSRSVGLVTIVEGQSLADGTGLDAAVRGPLGAPTTLDGALTLERLDARFWDNGEPRSYTGVYLIGDGDHIQRLAVTANAPQSLGGARYHQEQRVGYAFFITIERDGQVLRERLDLPQPPSAAQASYLDRTLSDGALLRAKCLVDENAGRVPTLTLRLVEGDRVVGETTLGGLSSGTLADAEVSIDAILRWGVLTIERSHGYELLFTSFFLIFVGAVLIYAAPPRELTMTRQPDGTTIAQWYAPRFATLFADEKRRLRDAAERAVPRD